MNVKEKIEELREASEDGTITAAQVTEAGLHRSVLQKFVKSGEIYRFGRGLYVWSDVWEDDSTFYSESMGAEFIRTILLCICGAIRIVPRQNIR